MTGKLFAVALVILLLNVVCIAPVAAASRESKEAKRLKEVKKIVARVGTGPKARLAIRLQDKTDLKGYVGEANDEHFVLIDEKTSATTTITYAQVEKVKAVPSGLAGVANSRPLKTAAIVMSIGIGALVVGCLVKNGCRN